MFEIKEVLFDEFVIAETVEIRYIRQDTSAEDNLKIETRLRALNWAWDFSHVGAAVIVGAALGLLIGGGLRAWLYDRAPAVLELWKYKETPSSKIFRRAAKELYINFFGVWPCARCAIVQRIVARSDFF